LFGGKRGTRPTFGSQVPTEWIRFIFRAASDFSVQKVKFIFFEKIFTSTKIDIKNGVSQV